SAGSCSSPASDCSCRRRAAAASATPASATAGRSSATWSTATSRARRPRRSTAGQGRDARPPPRRPRGGHPLSHPAPPHDRAPAGTAVVEKHVTAPDDPSRAIFEGLATLEERTGESLPDADRIVHGTTLVANSLIERRGARTALVTTSGFRDVIEIGRESRYD